MSSVVGKALDLPLLRRILRYAHPYSSAFRLTTFLTILLAFLGPVRPWIIQLALDDYILTPNPKGLLMIMIILVGVLVIEAIVQFYQTYLANWLGQSVIRDLRMDVYGKIIGFRLKYFDNTPIGTLVTRAISDIETIADIFSQGILVIIGDLLKLVVVVAVMFITDWRLALISLASIPPLIIATNIFKNAIKSSFQDVRTQVARLNAYVQEHIIGMHIVQMFTKEEEDMGKFKDINAQHRAAHIRSVWAHSVFFPIVEVLSALSMALLIWWGSKGVIGGEVSFGNLVAFILYIYMLFRPIRMLADRFNVLQMGMISSERVFKILDRKEEIINEGIKRADDIKGSIKFDEVWFSYNKNDWVLKGVSFSAEEGQMLAFVGATGAGKTSVINLLSRYYEFQKGSITIDNTDIREYDLNSLRHHIGVVLQDVFLFSGSIMDNVTLYNERISRDEVIEAAKKVGADGFISKLPGNYDYDVKERGAMLSLGQRQLIAFIRAYVYNPRILVLDEATSSVDTESEEMIKHAIQKLTEKRTSIVIAHRLSTIQNADKIIVLDKGRIVEAGSHEKLLEQDGYYRRLFDLQFKEN